MQRYFKHALFAAVPISIFLLWILWKPLHLKTVIELVIELLGVLVALYFLLFSLFGVLVGLGVLLSYAGVVAALVFLIFVAVVGGSIVCVWNLWKEPTSKESISILIYLIVAAVTGLIYYIRPEWDFWLSLPFILFYIFGVVYPRLRDIILPKGRSRGSNLLI